MSFHVHEGYGRQVAPFARGAMVGGCCAARELTRLNVQLSALYGCTTDPHPRGFENETPVTDE